MNTKGVWLTRDLVIKALETEDVGKMRAGAWVSVDGLVTAQDVRVPVRNNPECSVCAVGAVMSYVLDNPRTDRVFQASYKAIVKDGPSGVLDPQVAVELYATEDEDRFTSFFRLPRENIEGAIYLGAKAVVETCPLTALSRYFEGLSMYYDEIALEPTRKVAEDLQRLLIEFVRREFPVSFLVQIPEQFELSDAVKNQNVVYLETTRGA